MPISLHTQILNPTSSSTSFVIGLPQFSGTLCPPTNSQFPKPRFAGLFHHRNHGAQNGCNGQFGLCCSQTHHLMSRNFTHSRKPRFAGLFHHRNHGTQNGCNGQFGLCCSQTHHLMSRNFTHSRKPIIFRVGSTRPEADSEPEVEDSTPSSSASSGVSGSTGDDPFRDASESDSEVEEDDEGVGDVERWDVLGLGQAMVDFSGVVDDEFLESLGLDKGTRKLVNHEERGKVLRAMDGCSYKAAAGGSLSNSLVALARLGSQPAGGPVLNVAMAGSVGSDPLGEFYRAKLRRASVNFLSAPVKDGTTGTVIVLTTPDAQRTMLAYQGTSSTVNYDSGLSSLISKTNILVVEGYLFELADTIKAITQACKDAHSHGALVAVTASDVSCIERHYDDFWEIVGNYADIIFANSDEARALCKFSLKESALCTTRYLSHFIPLVSVTDGPRGSYIGVKGEAIYVPPSPCVPVDTCGAGDAYASGILYGILRGVSDFKDAGTIAARIAAVVVGQQGTRLSVQDAVELAESFAFHLQNSTI